MTATVDSVSSRSPVPGGVAVGVARAPGSCGELVQGRLGGSWLQISCPIEAAARARVRIRVGAGWSSPSPEVVGPAGKPKAVEAVRKAMGVAGASNAHAELDVASSLPTGKGMGSSTADVAAAAAATLSALGMEPAPDLIARLALSIEPTDGTVLGGIALFDHREGRVQEVLGPPPPVRILSVDTGGTVDTMTFNRDLGRRARWTGRQRDRWRQAFQLVREGVGTGDPEAVGRGATESALAHQDTLPHPLVPRILDVARQMGALGLARAHSGTVLGLLFPPGEGDAERVRDVLEREGMPPEAVREHRLASGGVCVEEGAPRKEADR